MVYLSPFQQSVPCHPHSRTLIYGGSTIWNMEGYSGTVKGALGNLTLDSQNFHPEWHLFLPLWFHWSKQMIWPHRTSSGQRSASPRTPKRRMCRLMWATVTVSGKARDGEPAAMVEESSQLCHYGYPSLFQSSYCATSFLPKTYISMVMDFFVKSENPLWILLGKQIEQVLEWLFFSPNVVL